MALSESEDRYFCFARYLPCQVDVSGSFSARTVLNLLLQPSVVLSLC